MKRIIIAIFMSWLLFIGIDFLFHASIFSSLWKEDIPAFKPLVNLALLIPTGYLSFLLLTVLVWYLLFTIFKSKPPIGLVLKFALIFGLLFSTSNLFGLFSYVDIPLKHLLVFHTIYLIEIITVTMCLNHITYTNNLKKSIWLSIFLFFSLVIIGVVIQNSH